MATPQRIRERPAGEQPMIRLQQHGATVLTDAELLATVACLPTVEQAEVLLADIGGWRGLAHADATQLQHYAGIGQARAAQLCAAVELGRRLACPQLERTQIKRPADAAQMLLPDMSHLDQEELRVISLDTKNYVLTVTTVYRGSVNCSQVRTGEVFREAIRRNATGIIMLHNHPSGDPTPSPEDILVTRAIVEAGEILDTEVLDHLVIGNGRYVSLRERGLGFS